MDEMFDDELQAPKSKKTLIIIVVNVIILAGVVGFFLFASPGSKKEASADAMPGPVVPLEAFIVNLLEPGAERYLKVTVSVELESEEDVERIEIRKAQIRNEILLLLSNLSFSETQGEEKKLIIQQNILQRVNRVLPKGGIKRVYFTDFVIQ